MCDRWPTPIVDDAVLDRLAERFIDLQLWQTSKICFIAFVNNPQYYLSAFGSRKSDNDVNNLPSVSVQRPES